ncbi:MAG: trigger factor [Thiofilum sp.]|uniref:trigger factor n=1 Tax=Thiofilum sp. TaxID=2212733 RepID=UPI0025E45881|nr:trigger factor [Thiofilum sp.]MBK8453552.1 trigger factor [Thiofilum sp.]
MQVSVETTGNIDRKMTVTVPAERIGTEVEKRLQKLSKRVRIDGFRPGKVPMNVVRQRYAQATRQEVIGDVIEDSLRNALNQEKLRMAGLPQVDVQTFGHNEPLTYVAAFQVYPEFQLADVSGLAIKRPVANVTDADIDRMIETIRKQQKEWQNVERAAQAGDLVRLNFVGTLDDVPFEGGSAENFAVELGAGRMLPDFEAALVGMIVGEEKVADVKFPEDYQAENLKGKTAQFKLNVTSVQEGVLPEINEAFIERFGLETTTVETFRAEIKKNMERELSNAVKAQLKQQVMDGLAALHTFDVPNALTTEEAKQVRQEFMQNMGNQMPNADLPDELFKPQAERRVKLGLIVGQLIRENNIQRDAKRVDELLASLSMTYEDPAALVEYYRTNPQAMQTIEAAAMEELIVDWVLSKAQVTDEERSFEQVIGRAQGNIDTTESAAA